MVSGRLFRTVEIPLHDRITADADFSCSSPWAFTAILGQNLYSLPGQRKADGADFSHSVTGIEGTDAGGFGEAVALHDGDIEGLLKFFHGLFGQRGRTADTELQAAQVVLLAGRVGKQDLVDCRLRPTRS